jgi:pseudouridine synthase
VDWLARALVRAGVVPGSQVEEAVRDGRVRVNGKVVREPLRPLRPTDQVRLDGRPVPLAAKLHVLMFHKPKGVVSAPTDAEGVGTVFEHLQRVLPKELSGFTWHAVGRLDRNTTGLLLFTNDEQVVAHVTSPATHLPKRYRAQVGAVATEAGLAPLRRGVKLDGEVARPARARVLPSGEVEVVITEGRYHQVKRMLGAVGLPVLALHREAIGALELDVPEGAMRPLEAHEVRERLGYSSEGTTA